MKSQKTIKEISKVVNDDLKELEQEIKMLLNEDNGLNKELEKLLTAPAKRLRPLLGFLFSRAVFKNLNQKQTEILTAVELIHNATLIHDDVIDKADKRRGQDTIRAKFDENLAVIAGDFLLSVSMEKVISTGSIDVLKLFASALKSTCLGEINQHFNKFKITTIEEYIQKSKEKTALLFEIAVVGATLCAEVKIDEKTKQIASDFSKNFGIAFQIRDDLINIMQGGDDFESGVYTAPVIFAHNENPNILSEANISEALKNSKGIEKAKDLMDNYFNKSLSAIAHMEDSVYKKAIFELVEILKEL